MPGAVVHPDPHWAIIIPFVLLLLAIALLPLHASAFWHRHHAAIALSLGGITAGYYIVVLRAAGRLLDVAHEYFSFIVLIGALFVVAGGIHITVRGASTPRRNVTFLFFGALLANVLGTTGASMLLIRPWIRMNKFRLTKYHIVFFIFIVGNCGGCLTAIGDPPLFLGYLKGIPFLWVPIYCSPAWLVTNGLLLTIFCIFDQKNFLRAPAPVRISATAHERFRLQGGANIGWLAIILASVFVNEPVGLREVLMLVAAVCSYRTTAQSVHDANHFDFAPLKEVAWLFLGIFVTVVPAIDHLQLHGSELGLRTPLQFYWSTGVLSSVLDNAPTYLAFLAAAFGIKGMLLDNPANVARFVDEHANYVLAVSLGSVFFGALTYIGNAPNFMVKTIAERHGVHVPSFFGYVVKFAVPILLPLFALVGWLFLRG